MKEKQTASPPGKRFYGTVTVSERGQIVVPSGARKDFGIRRGDKLLVLGDLEQGIAIVPMSNMQKLIENANVLQSLVANAAAGEKPPRKTKKAGE